jgi:hypothetical protein
MALHQIWCSYHKYVGEAIRFRILWHHNGPFGKLSNHPSCFFTGVKVSLNGPTCYACLFRMLDINHPCTNLSFLVRWSPYFFSCDGTCINWYLFLPSIITWYPCDVTWGHLITCHTFQEFSCVILSSNVIFFDGPTTRTRIYFASTHYTKTQFLWHIIFFYSWIGPIVYAMFNRFFSHGCHVLV